MCLNLRKNDNGQIYNLKNYFIWIKNEKGRMTKNIKVVYISYKS